MIKPFQKWVLACLVAIAFLAPLKFGTPVVIQSLLVPPVGGWEWLFFSWPNQLVAIFVFAALVWLVLDPGRLAARVDTLFVLPLIWLVALTVSIPGSINRQVSADTFVYFAVCVWLFYTAAWYVRDGAVAAQVFGGLGLATVLVCLMALQQYLGGLEETRAFAALYLDPSTIPADLALRMKSNRVFAWFFGYPNALAGYLVLVFAPVFAWIWARARRWDGRVKWVTLVLMAGLMIVCLVLTGSRGGLLAFAAMGVTALGLLSLGRGQGITLVGGAVLALLVVGFVAQRSGLVRGGMDSVGSRLDYWRGAAAIARDHRWTGTGPGTFGSIYPTYKTTRSEEARLVHNDFLQMWSDSGMLAGIVFAALWLVAVRDAFRLARERLGDAAAVAICAALVGWVVHGVVDFDLYVPGVALPAFLLLGALQGLKELPDWSPVQPRSRSRVPVAIVCLGVAGAVVWHEAHSLSAAFHHGEALALKSVNPVGALAEARRAVNLDPGNGHYLQTAGELALAQGQAGEAVAFFEAAVRHDPYRAWNQFLLASAKHAAGADQSEVVNHLKRAVELNPTEPRYRRELAVAKERVRQ